MADSHVIFLNLIDRMLKDTILYFESAKYPEHFVNGAKRLLNVFRDEIAEIDCDFSDIMSRYDYRIDGRNTPRIGFDEKLGIYDADLREKTIRILRIYENRTENHSREGFSTWAKVAYPQAIIEKGLELYEEVFPDVYKE